MTVHECPKGYHDEPSAVCYKVHRCRCNGCRGAHGRREVAERRRRLRRVERGELAVPHGTHNGYINFRCRCDDCRAAASVYRRERRQAAL